MTRTGEGLAHIAQEGDYAIVVAIASVTLVLVERDNLSIQHVLGDSALPVELGCDSTGVIFHSEITFS